MRRACLVALLSLAACDSTVSHTPVERVPAPEPEFVSADGFGPRIVLRQNQVTDTTLRLDVVGHELVGVYGVAFRLAVQADVLSVTAMNAAGVWPSGSTIAQARRSRPGLGFFVVTSSGAAKAIDIDGQVLATIMYERLSELGSEVSFDTSRDRNAVIGSQGDPVDGITWIGGVLEP
jgi:hypothetical protein